MSKVLLQQTVPYFDLFKEKKFYCSVNPIQTNMKSAKFSLSFLILFVFCDAVLGQNLKDFEVTTHNIAIGNRNEDKKANINVGLMADVVVLNGCQMSFGPALVRERAIGFNSSLVRAITLGDMQGMQFSLVSNVVDGEMKGLQFSGVINSSKQVRGMQLTIFNNIAIRMQGVQLSGIENIALSTGRGLQLASVMNICIDDMHGAQISAFNYADEIVGLQLGMVNICTQNQRGTQIGLFNYSRESNSRKIGLVNLSPQTRIQMMVFGGNASKFNMAARFRNNNTYNIVGLGTHYMGLDKEFSGSLFYRIGYWTNVFNDNWSVNADIGFSHTESFKQDDLKTPERLYSLNTNVSLEYQCLKRLGFFAGAGYGVDRYYEHNETYKRSFLVKVGMIFF